MDRTRWKLYAEAFRLWLPIVLSLCAMSLTIYQASVMRRHQRLSVTPHLALNVSVTREGNLVYTLANVGFGPAVLKDIAFTIDGKPIGPDGLETCAKVDAALSRGAPDWDTGCFDKAGDFVIPAGAEETIYASTRAPASTLPPVPPRSEEYLRFGVVGNYCSFYDDCWKLE